MLKNKISREKQDKFCNEFITFFKEEKDEDIGIIQAQLFLDFFIENFGKEMYNKGIEDASNHMREKLEELNFTLEELKE